MMCNLVNGYQHFGDTLWPTSHTCSNPEDHNQSLHHQNSVQVSLCVCMLAFANCAHIKARAKLCTKLDALHFVSCKVRLANIYYTVNIICDDMAYPKIRD
jgi:hypothetical protein